MKSVEDHNCLDGIAEDLEEIAVSELHSDIFPTVRFMEVINAQHGEHVTRFCKDDDCLYIDASKSPKTTSPSRTNRLPWSKTTNIGQAS